MSIALGKDSVNMVLSAIMDGNGEHAGSMAIWEVTTDQRSRRQSLERNAQSLATASEELSAVAKQMSGSSEQTTTLARTVGDTSSGVTRNVASVAATAPTMTSTVRRDRQERERGREGGHQRRSRGPADQHTVARRARARCRSERSSRSSRR